MFTAFSALNESDGESPLGEIEPLDTSNLDPVGGGDWRELQEEALRLYQEALRLYARKEYKSCIQRLEEVHKSAFLKENPTKIPHEYQAILEKLRFNSSKYLGFSYRRFKKNDKALDQLLIAFKLDDSDVVLSYETGVCALSNGKWHLARAAWENALRKSASALHWPSLEGLIGLTFRTGDHFACEAYIDRALAKDPKYDKGLKIKAKLWGIPEPLPHMKDVLIKDPVLITRSLVIRPTFEALLESLLSEYSRLKDQGSLHLPYVLTCAKRAEVKVSLQNESDGFLDFTLQSHGFSGLVVEAFVDEIIEGVFQESKVAMVEEILLGVVEKAASEANVSARSFKRSKSFLEAVPMELMEIRRSSRAKMPNVVISAPVIPTVAELPPPVDEFNALAHLQSLIPKTLQNSQASPEKKKDKSHKTSEEESQEGQEQLTDTLQKIRVKKFVEDKGQRSPINNHLIQSLVFVSASEVFPWPDQLITVFVNVYWAWRSHFVLPNEFRVCHDRDQPPDYADCMILANELTVETATSETIRGFSDRYEDDILHLKMIRCLLSPQKNARLDYLEFKYHHKAKDIQQATNCGKLLLKCTNFDLFPTVNYVAPDYFMSKLKVQDLLKSMECAQLGDRVDEYFTAQNFAKVEEILSPTLDLMALPSTGLFFWIQKYYLLIESLWELEKFHLCVERCTQVLRILQTRDLLLQAPDDVGQLVKFIHCSWQELDDQGRKDLAKPVKSDLCQVLMALLANQIENEESGKDVLLWVLLYEVILSEDSEAKLSNDFLVSAHDYMGQLSICTQRNGELLQALVRSLVPILSEPGTQLDSAQREAWKKCVDQALFCLYSHPSKKTKAKHLSDHGVPQLALTWNKCEEIFRYLKPKIIPTLVDPKSMSISVDTEMMFNRIHALVPEMFHLEERKRSVQGYIKNNCMERPSFESNGKFPKALRDLFFLLADYHFKNGDHFEKAIELLYLDISFNPRRSDAWILLALSLIKLLEEKLNLSDKSLIQEVLNDANVAQICCQKVFILDKHCHSVFLTETANFTYEIVSYCSYIIKSDDITDLSIDAFTKLEKAKAIYSEQSMKYHELAYQRISKNIDALESDDRWLVSLMKGKLCEKVKVPYIKAFSCYSRAVRNLFDQCGSISKKISYNNPTQFSLELLEAFYRIHASTLKNALRPILDPTLTRINDEDLIMIHENLKDIHDLDFLGLSEEPRVIPPDITREERIEQLFHYCVIALESILIRFSHHFKSLYMLAFYHAKAPKVRDPEKALSYLVANPSAPKPSIQPLFTEKKTHNFFNGIWRFPVPDFDRPGNFFKHVGKSVSLCLDLCEEVGDHATLAEITWHLRKPMDKDKVYLFEKDRMNLAMDSRTKLVKVLQKKTNQVKANTDDGNTLLLAMFHVYNKLKKLIPQTMQIKKMIHDIFLRRSLNREGSCEEAFAYCQLLLQNEKRLGKRDGESEEVSTHPPMSRSNSNTTSDAPMNLSRKALDPQDEIPAKAPRTREIPAHQPDSDRPPPYKLSKIDEPVVDERDFEKPPTKIPRIEEGPAKVQQPPEKSPLIQIPRIEELPAKLEKAMENPTKRVEVKQSTGSSGTDPQDMFPAKISQLFKETDPTTSLDLSVNGPNRESLPSQPTTVKILKRPEAGHSNSSQQKQSSESKVSGFAKTRPKSIEIDLTEELVVKKEPMKESKSNDEHDDDIEIICLD
ncbi:calcineurin-binding protein cabin-1-like [Tigriopus californicus]|uniref:calcineurin-binding protein cabin-1-like n=1 Tax=Tigriopus californicus TaxID=6832 RepID=UPI0027DA0AAC|nr:calcineurin-binding protein cabin-1-like [Tigriopus californicus]